MDWPRLVHGLEAQATRLTTPCGDGSLVWRRWGSGHPVVLMHGGYGSWTHWIRTITALAKHYSVIAVDLPGLGDSAMPPIPATTASVVRIVSEGLDRVVQSSERCHLVGFSLGAALAGPLAVRNPARVSSVTLVAPGGLPRLRPAIELSQWRDAPLAAQAGIHRENLAKLMIADAAAINGLAVHLQAANAARGRLKSRTLTSEGVLAQALPEVSAPVGAILGARDATVYPHLAERERLLRTLRPDIHLRVIPNAGHWVQYEAPQAFNSSLLDLLTLYQPPRQ